METKEKAEATRAAKARAAEIRRQLDELRQEDQDGDVSKSESLDQPITKADMGSFFASSLQSAVKNILYFSIPFIPFFMSNFVLNDFLLDCSDL